MSNSGTVFKNRRFASLKLMAYMGRVLAPPTASSFELHHTLARPQVPLRFAAPKMSMRWRFV